MVNNSSHLDLEQEYIKVILCYTWAFLVSQMVKNPLQCKTPGCDPWVSKIPWKNEWLPTLVFLLGEFHGHRSLAGYSPWGRKEMDTTKQPSTPTCVLRVSETLQESRQGNSPAISPQVLTFMKIFTFQSNNDPGYLLSIFTGSASVQSKIYWWS